MPQNLYQSDFMEEVNDLMILLSRVMGLPTSSVFEEWMWYFVEKIPRGETKFHWAKMIIDNIHNQFIVVKKIKEFYMNSYVVYLLEVNFPYKGINCVDELGTKKGKTPSYDCYP